jgi:glycosyltransferase involved in cell wall biosynthesis
MSKRPPPRESTVSRVLFLAYYFPPHGGGGVQRSLNFARHLPAFGYECAVVTGPGSTTEWAPADEALSERLPAGTEVFRVPGPEPRVSRGLHARAVRWLRLEEPFSRWWVDGAVAAGGAPAARADVIYASMSPFETAEAAARLAEASSLPWVADLRDPWALDEWLVYPTRFHRRHELGRMRATLASASAVVMNTPEAAGEVRRRFPELGEKPVLAIPNGFDAGDFSGPRPARHGSTFRIAHAGNVFPDEDSRLARVGRALLGGSVRGLDTSTRSHLYLLEAVDALRSASSELGSRVEVHLAGPLSAPVRRSLPPWVKAHGFLPHRETVALLRSSDLLFLPMHDLPARVRSRIVPGKTYEYLGSRTPILAALPDGDARDLLAEAGNAFLCRPKDVDGMARIIREQAERAFRGEPGPAPREDVLRRYDRRRLTADLAAVFDGVVPKPEEDPRPLAALA